MKVNVSFTKNSYGEICDFQINGKMAYISDFGASQYDLMGYLHQFYPMHPKKEVLKTYEITEKEFFEIADTIEATVWKNMWEI